MSKHIRQINFSNGILPREILFFCVPVMLSSVLQLLFNAADLIVVGRYAGEASRAAVGSNTFLINLFISFFVGLSVGTNVVMAKDIGEKRYHAVSRGIHTSIIIALIGGCALAVIGIPFAQIILEWTMCPSNVIDLATQYLRIVLLSMPAMVLYNFGSAILRAKGDTLKPLHFLLFSGSINVILNLIFVIHLGLGVQGVATATVITQYISALLIVRTLTKEKSYLRLTWAGLKFDSNIAHRIISSGLPAGLQNAVFAISHVFIQSAINSLGQTVVSGIVAASSIENFILTTNLSIQQTALTFTSQNYGAKQYRRIDKVAAWSSLYIFIFCLLGSQIILIWGEELLSIYAPDEPQSIAIGMIRFKLLAPLMFVPGLMEVFIGMLRGLGKSTQPMLISIFGACVLRVAWVVFIFPIDPTLERLLIVYPITWIITLCGLVVTFYIIRRKMYANKLG